VRIVTVERVVVVVFISSLYRRCNM